MNLSYNGDILKKMKTNLLNHINERVHNEKLHIEHIGTNFVTATAY